MTPAESLPTTVLRAVERHDLEATRRWRNDPRVSGPALGRRFPIAEVGEENWFRNLGEGAFPTSVVWAVAGASDPHSIVGLARLEDVDWIHRTAWFGIWIGPEHWGHGHGLVATWLSATYAFSKLGLRQLRLNVLASNEKALRLYERLGFQRESTMQGAVIVDGMPTDLMVMRLECTDLRFPESVDGASD